MIKNKRSRSSESNLRKYSKEFLTEKITGRERGGETKGLATGGHSYEEYFGGPRASNIILALLGLPQSFQDLISSGINFIMSIFSIAGAIFPELGNAGSLLQNFLGRIFTADTDRIAKNAFERSWRMKPGNLRESQGEQTNITQPLNINDTLSNMFATNDEESEIIPMGHVDPEDMFDDEDIPETEAEIEVFIGNLFLWMTEVSQKSDELERMEIGDLVEEFIKYMKGINQLPSHEKEELEEIVAQIPIAKYSLAPDTFMRRAGNPVLYRTVDVVVEGYLVNAKNLTQDQRDEIATRRQQLRSDLRVF